MCELVSNLLQKFIRKKLVSGVDSENLLVDIHFKENWKVMSLLTLEQKQRAYLMNRHTNSKLLKTRWKNFEKIA